MEKIKVACFGMQGFGNDLIKALVMKDNIEITALYTPSNPFEFEYYDCEKIDLFAESLNIPVYYIDDKNKWKCDSSDLAIISSFHRIFKTENLEKFNHVINIHPSILPKYRGATPTNWMVKNGEKIVGISAHLVKESVDTEPVIFQKKLINPYLNDCQLRKALSFLVRDAVDNIISSYPNFKEIKSDNVGTYFRPRTGEDGLIVLDDITSLEELIFHIKAFTNYPMPKLKIKEQIFVIDYESPTESVQVDVCNSTFDILGKWQES